MKRPWLIGLLASMGLLAFAGCAEKEKAPVVIPDVVVIDKLESLKDGQFIAYKLDPGRYKVEMTASQNGASLKWEGCSCPGSGETKAYSSMCELTQTGQVVIENPTGFGMGSPTTVTLKVTKLGGVVVGS